MNTYRITIYQEVYTELKITTKNKYDAQSKALSSDYSEDAVLDVTVKESDVLSCKLLT